MSFRARLVQDCFIANGQVHLCAGAMEFATPVSTCDIPEHWSSTYFIQRAAPHQRRYNEALQPHIPQQLKRGVHEEFFLESFYFVLE